MSIQVELSPDEEAQLRERAAEEGREPGELLRDLVRRWFVEPARESTQPLLPVIDETGTLREERWQAVLASIRKGSANAPTIPLEALRREALYQKQN